MGKDGDIGDGSDAGGDVDFVVDEGACFVEAVMYLHSSSDFRHPEQEGRFSSHYIRSYDKMGKRMVCTLAYAGNSVNLDRRRFLPHPIRVHAKCIATAGYAMATFYIKWIRGGVLCPG